MGDGSETSPRYFQQIAINRTVETIARGENRILLVMARVSGRHTPLLDHLATAIAPDGSLVLFELKRNRTPREVVAQAIDYAAWIESLSTDRIAQIYQRFSGGGNLDEAFRQRFKVSLDEDALNESHQFILVAAELDDSTERIINYLNARDIAINVIYFQVFTGWPRPDSQPRLAN